jgi:hypothetical protein
MKRVSWLLGGALLALASCGEGSETVDDGGAASAPTPAVVSAADLQMLRWLEGNWVGSADGGAPFYESYRFLNDSTIESRTYTDSTLSQPSDSGRIAIAGGVLTSRGGNATYVATRLDSTQVHFEPLQNANNAFTWTRQSSDAWTAVLQWTDASGAAQERTYHMRRIGGGPTASAAELALEGEGLRLFLRSGGSARPLSFGTPAADVLRAVDAATGSAPSERGESADCGAEYARWSDGPTVWLDNGRFVGWSLRGERASLTTPTGVGIGTTRAEIESAHTVRVADSSLGIEFTVGGLAGLLESSAPDGRVTALWAGEACIMR